MRRVKPPVKVWVDVGRLLAPERHHVYRNTPQGLELGFEVVGYLGGWIQRGDGGWLALVSYALSTRDDSYSTEVTHWVPAHLVRRYSLVRNQKHAPGGLGH